MTPRADITACPKGHAYTPENSMLTSKSRRCRICMKKMRHDYYMRRRDMWPRRVPLASVETVSEMVE